MKTITITLTIISVTLFVQTDSMADMYKWTDENGVVHYSDTPPPENAPKKSNIETLPTVNTYVEENNQSNETPKPTKSETNSAIKKVENKSPAPKPKPKSRVQYSTKNSVELFTTSWCGYCNKAKRFFESRGIAYTEYDVEKDRAAAKRFRKLNGKGGVPFAIVNGQSIKGYNTIGYENALLK